MEKSLESSFREAQSHAQSMRTGPTSFRIPRFAPGTAVSTPVSTPVTQAPLPPSQPVPAPHHTYQAAPTHPPLHPGLPSGVSTAAAPLTGNGQHQVAIPHSKPYTTPTHVATPALGTPLDQKYGVVVANEPQSASEALQTSQCEDECPLAPPKKSKLWIWIVIGVVVLIVIVVVVVVLRSKKTKKAADNMEHKEKQKDDPKEPEEVKEEEEKKPHKPSDTVKAMSQSLKNRIEAQLQAEISSARSASSVMPVPAGAPPAAGSAPSQYSPTDATALDHTGPLPPLNQPTSVPRGPPLNQPTNVGSMPHGPPPGATSAAMPVGGLRQAPPGPPASMPVANAPRPTAVPMQPYHAPPSQGPPPPAGMAPQPPMPPPPRPTVPYAGQPMAGGPPPPPQMPPATNDPLGTPL